MFFEERIKSIKETDKVLEIGPGATPHWRSDVFLERNYASTKEYIAQTGHVGELKTDKRIVFYDGGLFPFEEHEFDYVICSHVLEHVDNPELFLKEIQRVGKKGYLEFPTLYYDYIYNFPEHTMLLMYDGRCIHWMSKVESGLNQYKNVQAFFYRTCELEYYSLIGDLKEYFFQGFEWENTILCKKAQTLDELCYDLHSLSIPQKEKQTGEKNRVQSFKSRVKNKLINWLQQW
ncbi:MAG TPA: methyltransferase domain-containing protein [Cytophagaceae bacterium]|jgi:SAM-dependent methyltransferase|nr:methyltransferase domain-containing protein [Cytophagaceae bacterium]